MYVCSPVGFSPPLLVKSPRAKWWKVGQAEWTLVQANIAPSVERNRVGRDGQAIVIVRLERAGAQARCGGARPETVTVKGSNQVRSRLVNLSEE